MNDMRDLRSHGPRAVTWLAIATLATGCVPIGPNSVLSDQVNYADAISEASKRLTLTNIVKTRYGDAPSYLVASQVVAGYQLQANVSVNTDLELGSGWSFGDSAGLSLGGQFNDNPTITYTPVAGADFAALLLEPISVADVYALIAGGRPADLVLGLLLGQINGLRNTLIERPGTTSPDGRFAEVLGLAAELSGTGAFHLRVDGKDKDRKPLLVLPETVPDSPIAKRMERFRHLLGLDPNRSEFPLLYGSGTGGPEAIRVLTRSIAEIIRDLASLIDVPAEDIEAGRTYPTYVAEEEDLKRVRIHARVSDFRPVLEDTFVAAGYRGRWFWIADTDFRSKQVFSFVIELLQLAQTTTSQGLPVITIPSG